MITEMIQYRIQVEDLEAVRGGLSPDSALYHKLGDIIAIWRQFVSYTEAHTAASEKILDFFGGADWRIGIFEPCVPLF